MFQPTSELASVTVKGVGEIAPVSGSTGSTVDILVTLVFSALTRKPARDVCALFISYEASNWVPYIWLARVTSEATSLNVRSPATSGMKCTLAYRENTENWVST